MIYVAASESKRSVKHLLIKGGIINFFLVLLCLVVTTTGCMTNEASKIKTATDLAKALDREGIHYKTIEQRDTTSASYKYSKPKDDVELKGDNIHIAIFSVEKEREHQAVDALMATAAVMAFMVKKDGVALGIPKVYFVKDRLVVVVYEEPSEDAVWLALTRIFPRRYLKLKKQDDIIEKQFGNVTEFRVK